MLTHIAVWGALQLGEGLVGRGVAAQSASRTPGWNRPRVRHIWVEPNAVLPPPGENWSRALLVRTGQTLQANSWRVLRLPSFGKI